MTGAKSKKTKKGRPSLYTEALANRVAAASPVLTVVWPLSRSKSRLD